MTRFLLGLLGVLAVSQAVAADNAIVLTPGVGVAERSVDVGSGVQAPGVVIVNSAGTNIVGAGSTVPVAGAVTATQTGTWTVQPGNTANSTAWLVTGTGGTFPITAAALPLPSAASTAALQTTGNSTLSTINTSLGTINTTLGTPFQAGGSIGNTTFAVTNTGTFATQAAQSGTWNVTNISGTVSLPTGAATATLQTTANGSLASIVTNTTPASLLAGTNLIGKVGIDQTTPGTTNAVAVTNTNLTVVQATGSNLHVVCDSGCVGTGGTSVLDQSTFTAGVTGITPAGGIYFTSIPQLTNAQSGAVALTASRSMHVIDDNSAALLAAVTSSIPAGTNLIGKTGIDQTTPGVTNGVSLTNASVTVIQGTGSNLHVACNSGCSGSGGTAIADRTAFSYGTTLFTPMGGVYNSAITSLTSGQSGAVALTAARSMHTIDDNSAAILAAVTGAVPAGANTIGSVGLAASTSGGCTPGHLLSAASTNSTNIKSTAGTLCSMTAINTTGTLYYLKLYNTTVGPTCNSDTVLSTFPVPASTSGAGVTVNLGPYGFKFTAGISFCLTSGIADNDNGSAAAGVALSYGFI